VSAIAVGTALGAGLLPLAPGTMGTLIAVPLAYFTAHAHWGIRAALWSVLLAAGIWASKVFDEIMGSKDNQNIVIDEVVGFGITAWTAGVHPWTLLASFIVFRFFDIVKPPPVRQVDNWSRYKASSKNPGNIPGSQAPLWWSGFGVMADDVLAGFQGLIVILILQHYGVLP
jgi:phosphatidylglycerophosphatase A